MADIYITEYLKENKDDSDIIDRFAGCNIMANSFMMAERWCDENAHHLTVVGILIDNEMDYDFNLN